MITNKMAERRSRQKIHHAIFLIGLGIYFCVYFNPIYTYMTSIVSVYSNDHSDALINSNVTNSSRLKLPEQISGTGQPIPAAFVYTKELYDTKKKVTNSTIVMNPEVYLQLTNQIRRIKHARKPLRVMINSHPCAGKTTFIKYNANYFMGCKLADHDTIKHGVARDSSYLMDDKWVKNNTALFGKFSAHHGNYTDVVYIHVIPPMTIIEQNIIRRQKESNDGARLPNRWDKLEEVTKNRRMSLLHAIKDEVLVEPLFATFREGLEFCINTYNIDM